MNFQEALAAATEEVKSLHSAHQLFMNTLGHHRNYVNTLIDLVVVTYLRHLTPMEKLWVLEPNVAVQYSRPYFSRPNLKEKIAVWLCETNSLLLLLPSKRSGLITLSAHPFSM